MEPVTWLDAAITVTLFIGIPACLVSLGWYLGLHEDDIFGREEPDRHFYNWEDES